MNRQKILQEILSDEEIMEKYSIRGVDLPKIKSSPPFSKTIIEVLSTIINENDNNLSEQQIYKRIKNIYKI